MIVWVTLVYALNEIIFQTSHKYSSLLWKKKPVKHCEKPVNLPSTYNKMRDVKPYSSVLLEAV